MQATKASTFNSMASTQSCAVQTAAGETTILSALDHMRRINWMGSLQSWSQGHNPSQVTLWEWFDVRPAPRPRELFDTGADKFQVRAAFFLPIGTEEHRRIEPLIPVHNRALRHLADRQEATASSVDPICVAYSLTARSDQKAQLESVGIEGQEFFRSGEPTRFAPLVPFEQHKVPVAIRHNMVIEDPRDLFEPLNSLLNRVVYFPSNRQPRVGSDGKVGWMAGRRWSRYLDRSCDKSRPEEHRIRKAAQFAEGF